MDFDLLWTLDDARYVTAYEYFEYLKDLKNEKKRKDLEKAGRDYTKSLEVINSKCKDELKSYRSCLINKTPETDQKIKLNALYTKYLNELKSK